MNLNNAVFVSLRIIVILCVAGSESRDGYLKRVSEGSQVSLQCQIPVQPEATSANLQTPVVWLRFDMKDPDNHVLISHGETILSDDSRLGVSFDAAAGNSVLVIDKVELGDGGSYQCQVLMDNDEITSPPIELIVLPRLVPIGSSSSSSLMIGPFFLWLAFLLVRLLQ